MMYYGYWMYGLYGVYWCVDEDAQYPDCGMVRMFDKNRADMLRGSGSKTCGFSVRTLIVQ